MASIQRILATGTLSVAKRPAGTVQPPALAGPGAGPIPAKAYVQITPADVTVDNSQDPAVLNVAIPAYDPATTYALTELYAIVYPAGVTIPTDPSAVYALASSPTPPAGVSVFSGGVAHINGAPALFPLAGLGNDQADVTYQWTLLGTDEVV